MTLLTSDSFRRSQNIQASIEGSLATDLSLLQQAQSKNMDSIDQSDFEIAKLLGQMNGALGVELSGLGLVNEDAVERVERKTRQECADSSNSSSSEEKKKYVSLYARSNAERIEKHEREREEARAKKRAKEKRTFMSSILGKKDGPSKSDIKKWNTFIDQAIATQKVIVGIEKMIAVGMQYPDKTTLQATNSQRFHLEKHQEELQMLKIGLNSAIPHANRTVEQHAAYSEIFLEDS